MATFHPRRDQMHQVVGGALAPGAAYTNGSAVRAIVQLAGAARFRVRFKGSGAGSLALAFLRPGATLTNPATAETYNTAPSPVAVTANTEAVLEVAEHFGEHGAVLTFTPSADGTVTWCDIARL